MTSVAFIIGTLIVGICIVAAAFILSGAVTGAAAASKESAPQSLQQPTLSFLTEFDAADYLGVSLNELDYMRGEGMLENTFVAVTSMEQTGEEEYYAMEDGVEVVKVRPVMSPVTRFLFNRQLLDERMLEIIKQGQHVNPTRPKNTHKKSKNEGQKPGKSGNGGNNGGKGGSARPERRDGERRPERREGDSQQGSRKQSSDRPEERRSSDRPEGKKNDRSERPERTERTDRGAKQNERTDAPAAKSDRREGSAPAKKPADEAPKASSIFDDSDDDIFARPVSAADDDFFGGSSASISVDEDDGFDLDVFAKRKDR